MKPIWSIIILILCQIFHIVCKNEKDGIMNIEDNDPQVIYEGSQIGLFKADVQPFLQIIVLPVFVMI